MAASREFINSVDPMRWLTPSATSVRISRDHFEHALEEVNLSVAPETREQYEELEEQFQQAEPGQGRTARPHLPVRSTATVVVRSANSNSSLRVIVPACSR